MATPIETPRKPTRSSGGPSYYRVEEAAEKLRIGVRALRDGVNHHGWPYSRPGGKFLVFDDDDLATIYRMYRVSGRPSRRPRRA